MGNIRKKGLQGNWISIHSTVPKYVSLSKEINPYVELSAAILRNAVREYINALITNHEKKIAENEAFFLSDRGQLFSFNQGDYIIREARQIAENMKKEKL